LRPFARQRKLNVHTEGPTRRLDHILVVAVSSFSATVTTDGVDHVVHLEGELDIETRDEAYEACLGGASVSVVVDLSQLTFMDCAGYGCLVAAHRMLQLHGGSLRFRGPVGQPARLLCLLKTNQQSL
jgi:anti-anti-sigma factor